MIKLKILKLHSMSNDYVVVDLRRCSMLAGEQLSALAVQLCNRRGPVGCDGVAFITSVVDTTATISVINPSGLASELCINGIRCAARAVLESINRPVLNVPTKLGTIELTLVDDLAPNVPGMSISLPFVAKLGLSDAFINPDRPLRDITDVDGLRFYPVELGIPHLVGINPALPDKTIETLGAKLQTDVRFPNGINVSIASPLGEDRLFVRTYERGGAGLTRSCSSGILATSWLLTSQGLLPMDREIACFTLGGVALVRIHARSMGLMSNVTKAFDADLKIHEPSMHIEPLFSGNFYYEEAESYHLWLGKLFADEDLATIQKTVDI